MGCVHYISSFTRARDARATSRATHDVARADADDLIASATDGNRRRQGLDEVGRLNAGSGSGGGLTNARARDANRRMNC